MALAIAAMGGFLFWLYSQAESLEEDVQPAMEDTTGAEAVLTASSLAGDPGGAVGRTTTLDSLPVAGSLGRGVFTLSLPADTANPDSTIAYPVLMSRDLIQQGTAVYGGDRVSVHGRFYTLNDSIRSEWVNRGAVDSAAAGGIPSIASFMLADSVDIL